MTLRPLISSWFVLSLMTAASACLVGVEEGADDGVADGSTATGGMDDGVADASGSGVADGTGTDATSGDDGPEQDGVELFLGLCAPCHGMEGQGVETLGYELRHPVREYATWVIRNGRSEGELAPSSMSAYPPEVVSDAQLQEIFDWLDGFPQPETGEGLYMDYCRNCHGVDPNDGGVVAKEVGEKGFADALEKIREGEGGTAYGSRLAYMPGFDAGVLSDAEVMLITDWFAGG